MTSTPTAPEAPVDRIERSPLPAAEPPKSLTTTRWLGGVMAIALAALGVAALRDAGVAAGWLDGPAWTVQVLDLLDGLGPSRWQLVAGPIACLLGIGLIVAAISSRRRWYTFQTGQGIYLRPADIARLASVTAQDVDGSRGHPRCRAVSGSRSGSSAPPHRSPPLRSLTPSDWPSMSGWPLSVRRPAPGSASPVAGCDMSRTANVLNRLALLALGLVLLAGGAATTAWGTGRWQIRTGVVDTSSATRIVTTAWWPWAAALTGILLIALALRWIIALLVQRPVRTVGLSGSSAQGRLTVNADAVVRPASALLESTLGVRSAKGRWFRHRDRLVLELTAAIDPATDLDTVAAAYTQISADLAHALGRPDVQARLLMRAARRPRTLPRVN